VTYGVGIALIAWCVSRMQDATWEWLLVIPWRSPATSSSGACTST
jgi:hypothetical protein